MLESSQVDEQTIAARIDLVRARIRQACARAGRRADEVTLIGITKTFPIQAVAAARAAGLKHFGENRVQELVEKAVQLPGALQGGDLCWHMVGHLQRNKARDAVEHADLFHALDSPRLAQELDRRAAQAGRILPCLVQVNVSGEASKYGLDPEAVHAFLDSLATYEHIEVSGLMTIAAPTEDPEAVRPQFRLLRTLFETYDGTQNPRVEMKCLSMGMSGDFEVAVEEGATHVRIGSAIFGPRA